MCPFSILAFLQPTTVDKEPLKSKKELLSSSTTENKGFEPLRQLPDLTI